MPSIRWELLREGMEDYEYLWLLAGGDPQIDVPNLADAEAEQFIASRTLFSRVPTDLYAARAAIAALLAGPHASKRGPGHAVLPGEAFSYELVYTAAGEGHTVIVSDTVPALTPVLGAVANKPPQPTVDGQLVQWAVPVAARETVTLTIQAQATAPGVVTNRATFSGTAWLEAEADLLVAVDRLYLPLVWRGR